MTKETVKDNTIYVGDRWKVDSSVTILNLLKSNDRVTLMHMSRKIIKHVE